MEEEEVGEREGSLTDSEWVAGMQMESLGDVGGPPPGTWEPLGGCNKGLLRVQKVAYISLPRIGGSETLLALFPPLE